MADDAKRLVGILTGGAIGADTSMRIGAFGGTVSRKLGKKTVRIGASMVEIERTGQGFSAKTVDGSYANVCFYPCQRCGNEVVAFEGPACPHCDSTWANVMGVGQPFLTCKTKWWQFWRRGWSLF